MASASFDIAQRIRADSDRLGTDSDLMWSICYLGHRLAASDYDAEIGSEQDLLNLLKCPEPPSWEQWVKNLAKVEKSLNQQAQATIRYLTLMSSDCLASCVKILEADESRSARVRITKNFRKRLLGILQRARSVSTDFESNGVLRRTRSGHYDVWIVTKEFFDFLKEVREFNADYNKVIASLTDGFEKADYQEREFVNDVIASTLKSVFGDFDG